MARRRSRLRNLSEFAMARSVLWIVQWMPAPMVAPTSRALGRLLYRVLGRRRQVIHENLALAYGDAPDRPDAATVGRAAFAHLCLSFMELARFPWRADKAMQRVGFEDREAWERLIAAQDEAGVVLAGSHFGAYEVLGLVGPLFGLRCTTVARPLDNPYLEAWLKHARERFGQRVVTNRGGMGTVLEAIAERRAGGVLVDLNHRRRRRVWVDYFGVSAATAPTAAILALRTGRPVATIACRRGPGSLTYVIELGALHAPDRAADRTAETQRLMQAVTNEVEDRVRSAPGQWLWTQRRWKTRPEEAE